MNEDFKEINEWEVLTPNGWSDFAGVSKIVKNSYIKIEFNDGSNVECSCSHKFKLKSEKFIYATDISIGDELIGKDKNKIVNSIHKLTGSVDLYDLKGVEKNQEFYSNDIVSHNCAFIDNIEEIWLSAQYTLSTGGTSVVLSTPAGVGNWFHKTWVDAEAGLNDFNTIKLPWYLHPERDQDWRDKQTLLSGVKGSAQECDCDFSTSGNQVVEYTLLEFQKETHVKDPIEKRGPDGELWIWERVDYSKNYIVSADCARGDGSDYSACHVIDVENAEQVAEYRGRLGTKDYGNFLVSLATEYNNALLVVENNNIGWATLQQVIDRNYDNLFYTDMDLKVVDPDKNFTNKLNSRDRKSVPGFTTTQRNRPLMISKLEAYFVDKSITIHSIRTYDELCVFIWNGAKAEAMRGYNDDLVMSLSIGLWIRDTALKLRLDQMAYNKSMIEGITRIAEQKKPTFFSENTPFAYDANKTWKFTAEGKKEDLTWLL